MSIHYIHDFLIQNDSGMSKICWKLPRHHQTMFAVKHCHDWIRMICPKRIGKSQFILEQPLFTGGKEEMNVGNKIGRQVIAVMSEWLRRLTRNQLGSARVGSNPADCE